MGEKRTRSAPKQRQRKGKERERENKKEKKKKKRKLARCVSIWGFITAISVVSCTCSCASFSVLPWLLIHHFMSHALCLSCLLCMSALIISSNAQPHFDLISLRLGCSRLSIHPPSQPDARLLRITRQTIHSPTISSHHISATFTPLLATSSDSLIPTSTSVRTGSSFALRIRVSRTSVLLRRRC